MQELSISSQPKVKVLFDGAPHLLRKPKIMEVSELEDKLEAAGNSSKAKLDAILTFVIGCGLPQEVATELDVESLEAVISALSPKKKP